MMIEEKQFAKKIKRLRQNSKSRLGTLRLGMNEYVPHMSQELFNKIIKNFTVEKASAYPELNQAYELLSTFLNQKRDRILITSGADNAIKVIFETFCNEGDIVATCSPTFAMYKIHSNLLNCVLKESFSDNYGEFSEGNLIDLLNWDPKIIIIANPNGVTGFAFGKNTIIKLLEKSNKKNVVIVLDETYVNFGDIDMSDLLEKYTNLILVRSFSKDMGMAGIRIGYILSSEYLSKMMEKFKPMMEINSFAVEAIKVICSDKKFLNDAVKKIKESRSHVANELKKEGYTVIEKSGNFILVDFKEKRGKIEEELKNNKIEYRQLPHPLSKYIRFTVGTKELMLKFLEIVKGGKNEKN